ncbi:hypothetical protein GCM10010276_43330 [Streptomyces longisporus]|uniref:Uncharacterized protein n=1 Tax=Streptomyces longisporus TaxID=1948 RepID=A0ABN3MC39_STRLO
MPTTGFGRSTGTRDWAGWAGRPRRWVPPTQWAYTGAADADDRLRAVVGDPELELGRGWVRLPALGGCRLRPPVPP